MIVERYNEHGVGLIEVMIALAVMMFAALAISNVQTNSFISMKMSNTHFNVNDQANDMLDILRANSSTAKSGNYNLEFDSTVDVDVDTHPVLRSIAGWKNHISIELPEGAGQIDCDVDQCRVSIRWKENVDGSYDDQFYHIAGLM